MFTSGRNACSFHTTGICIKGITTFWSSGSSGSEHVKEARIHCIMIFIKFCFQGDIKYVSCLLRVKMQPKLIHDDGVYACKRGVRISLAWSVNKLDSFLRFTNDDHYRKFSNGIFCSKHGILVFLEP